MKTQPIVLSIAGSDNTGGAGIQADIKTCCAFGVYAATVVTGVTAQNSRKVFGVEPVSVSMIREQIDSIFEVMHPHAVKTGMLPSSEIIETVADKLREYNVTNIIVDPVMVATNGGALVTPGPETVEAFINHLLPLSLTVTPNLSEASVFLKCDVSKLAPEEACSSLLKTMKSKSVFLKGGHGSDDMSVDYYFDSEQLIAYSSPRVKTPNTHGTGCTLSSAIACCVAKGDDIRTAIGKAKNFIDKAISSAADLMVMQGPGPLDFFVR